jgi:hypothetical protein
LPRDKWRAADDSGGIQGALTMLPDRTAAIDMDLAGIAELLDAESVAASRTRLLIEQMAPLMGLSPAVQAKEIGEWCRRGMRMRAAAITIRGLINAAKGAR